MSSENQNRVEDYNKDVESQKTTASKKRARGRWRSLNLMLKAQQRLIILVQRQQLALAPDLKNIERKEQCSSG